MDRELVDWLSLSALPGLGCGLVRRLVLHFGSPGAVLVAGREVAAVEGIGRRTARLFVDRAELDRARCRAMEVQERAAAAGVHLLPFIDPRFPRCLGEIHDAPALLYLRGDLTVFNKPAVAVIGSRAATAYGKRISRILARELARAGVVVVSGLAAGVDGNAHQGCLEGGAATIGVLGCGVDVIYPRSNARLYQEIGARGLLVSEYEPGTRPEGFRFPARNRIISGLSLGVVIVEAARRSGSLITARLALDQGREVFAVPGRIDSLKSEGPHRLIQQGAHLVHTVDDILQELELAVSLSRGSDVQGNGDLPRDLSVEERQVVDSLEVYPVDIDDLAAKTGLAAAVLHGLLLQLELKGLVRQLPGQQYERVS